MKIRSLFGNILEWRHVLLGISAIESLRRRSKHQKNGRYNKSITAPSYRARISYNAREKWILLRLKMPIVKTSIRTLRKKKTRFSRNTSNLTEMLKRNTNNVQYFDPLHDGSDSQKKWSL